MLTQNLLDLRELHAKGCALARGESLGRAENAWLASIESLRPSVSISTADCAEEHRYIKSKDIEEPVKFHHEKVPFLRAIEDACDESGVTVVGVKGPARGLKTTAAENHVFRNWLYGPSYEVIWFMQSKDDVEEYCEERLEPMLKMHKRIDQHVNWKDRRHRLTRKKIRGALARFLAATPGSLRAKMAPIIIGDEIDGYAKRVRKGFLTMAKARQRELGLGALLYLCSHPDEGPLDGIDVVIQQSLRHLWYVNCPHDNCRKASSPAVEAEARMTWNVPQLLKDVEELDLRDILAMVEREARLICPHCLAEIDNDQRLDIMRKGTWLQPHQALDEHGEVHGDRRVERTMGFVIHGFMLPWGATIGELARDYVAAKLNANQTGDTSGLKEVVCKFLGETYLGADEEEQMEDWKVVQTRLTGEYKMGIVPPDVRFLVAFVDIQGDRFEVRVIGYGSMNRSWLIDCYSIKQPPADPVTGVRAFQNIDPANRESDWDVLEDGVINQQYPIAGNEVRREAGLPELFLPIARTAIDAHGNPGVHLNSVRWVGKVTDPNRPAIDRRAGRPARPQIPLWKVQLTHGAVTGHPNKRFVKHLVDDKAIPLPNNVYERTINVHHYKLIMSRRMKIAEPGPGRVTLPNNLPIKYLRELTAERLINGAWETMGGRNETWDAVVSGEAMKDLLDPDRPDINWSVDPPVWGKRIARGGAHPELLQKETVAQRPKSRYERMLELSGRAGDDDDDEGLGDAV